MKPLSLYIALALTSGAVLAEPIPSKPATQATIEANQAVYQALNFKDETDFKNAQRGLIAKQDVVTIKNANGDVVWDLEAYKQFISLENKAPDSVNPSLWRNAQLNMINGLFEVTEGIYQVRAYDLSNITFIKGDKGWIVFDPLISQETAKAALEFVNAQLGERPVTAVVYSHSHIDHFGGVRGIVNEEDVKAGNITLEKAIADGDVQLKGNKQVFKDFVGMLDKFDFWFNIVTP